MDIVNSERLEKLALRACSGLGLAVSVLLTACGTGDILPAEELPGADGQPLTGHGAAPAMVGGPTQQGGALTPARVFSNGEPVGCDPSVGGKVGRTPLRRLTKLEYDNTVRDVFGMELDPPASSDLPQDNKAGPFSSNWQDSLVALTLDKYRLAAERVAGEVAKRVEGMVSCATEKADRACAQEFLKQYGSRAYRRPLTGEQLAGLLKVFDAGVAGATFAEGISYAVQALLQSPAFMYHLEAVPKSATPVALSGHELAERLSYFFWASVPDEALMSAVDNGSLASVEGLRDQAERMFADARAAHRLDNFTEEWLALQFLREGHLDLPPGGLYADFTPQFAQDSLEEIKKFVAYVLRDARGDGKLETLLTSRESMPQGRSFDAYGMKPPAGYDGKTLIPVQGARAGVVAMPAVMMTHAAEATSPIRRGVFVLNELLCLGITFPVGVAIPEPPAPGPGKTIRQRLAEVTSEPACMGCHGLINPIGFAFEGYDRMGRERDVDEFGAAIDNAAILMLGDPTIDGPIDGAPALAEKLFRSNSGRTCMIQQAFRFALARTEEPNDTCSFAALAKDFADSGFDVRKLMVNVVLQDSFRFHPGR